MRCLLLLSKFNNFSIFFSGLSMMTNESLDCKMFSCRLAAGDTAVSTQSSYHTGRDWNYSSLFKQKDTNRMDGRRRETRERRCSADGV